MKIINYHKPESSFLSLEKDTSLILNLMLKNDRLKKLLYYTTPDCLSKPNLTEEESYALLGKQIKLVPKLTVNGDILNYIIINFDNFTTTDNPEFRDNIIEIDIICQFDQWQLLDLNLRPYKIAGEIDTMLNNSSLTGLGKVYFVSANQMILNKDYAGLCLMYQVVHGGEDKHNPLNPESTKDYVDNFNNIFNEK